MLRNAPDVAVMGAGVLRNLAAAFNRLDSNELPNITVRASYRDESWETTSDEEGYFAFEIEPENPLAGDDIVARPGCDLAASRRGCQWRGRDRPRAHAAADGDLRRDQRRRRHHPPLLHHLRDQDGARDAAQECLLTRHLPRRAGLLPRPARRRRQKLRRSDNTSDSDNNPIFYVSLSPWNLYSLLSQFLEINDIPSGPLILRDYSLQTLTSLGGPSPKRKLIQDLLDLYPELPFVLLGDSGQHDPEIYAEIVRENPNRILAIYIRDVSGGTDAGRAQEVAALAATTQACGVDMLLSPHTRTFATHAAALGLIHPLAVEEVEDGERVGAQGPAGETEFLRETRFLSRSAGPCAPTHLRAAPSPANKKEAPLRAPL